MLPEAFVWLPIWWRSSLGPQGNDFHLMFEQPQHAMIPARTWRNIIGLLAFVPLVWRVVDKIMPGPEWSSPYSGWRERATVLPTDTPFDMQDLVYATTYNAMGGDGFISALFKPDVMVTASGQIYRLAEKDATGFITLVNETKHIPYGEVGSATSLGHDRAYRIEHRATCQPFTDLHVPKHWRGVDPPMGYLHLNAKEAELGYTVERTNVYGYDKRSSKLVGSAGHLPSVLWELLGLAKESGFPARGTRLDEDLAKRLKEARMDLEALAVPAKEPDESIYD